MWDPSSLTKDRTPAAPCIGSTESYPLDCQGSPISFPTFQTKGLDLNCDGDVYSTDSEGL